MAEYLPVIFGSRNSTRFVKGMVRPNKKNKCVWGNGSENFR